MCVCVRSLRQQLKCHSDQTNGRATKRDRWMLGWSEEARFRLDTLG